MSTITLRNRMFTIMLITLALSTFVYAHTKLDKTEPADGAILSVAPPHVTLWFNQTPDLAVSKIEVQDASGKKVALGPAHTMEEKSLMATVKGKMGEGQYTVSWQAAGDDGHVSKGTFSFTVKRAK